MKLEIDSRYTNNLKNGVFKWIFIRSKVNFIKQLFCGLFSHLVSFWDGEPFPPAASHFMPTSRSLVVLFKRSFSSPTPLSTKVVGSKTPFSSCPVYMEWRNIFKQYFMLVTIFFLEIFQKSIFYNINFYNNGTNNGQQWWIVANVKTPLKIVRSLIFNKNEAIFSFSYMFSLNYAN